MKKSILWLMGVLLTVSFAVSSCEETDGIVDPYTNWQERNEAFIDSIAFVARAHEGDAVGQWKVIHTYKYPQQGGLVGNQGNVDEYVYCKILKVGSGETPLYTDTVAANYRGKLIPLYDGQTVVFEQSYRGNLDENTAVPVEFSVGSVIPGWTTALLDMKVGDRWEIYIPSALGYGKNGSGSIPGNSTLIFDLNLAKVMHMKGNPQDPSIK